MIILNDEELVEGIFGAIGWILSVIYFRKKYKNENFIIIGGFGWCIIWFTRKIGMRVYRKLKQKYKFKERGIKIKNFTGLSDRTFRLIILLLLLFLAYYFLIHNSPVDDNFPKLNITTYSLMAGFAFLFMFVFGRNT